MLMTYSSVEALCGHVNPSGVFFQSVYDSRGSSISL
jgi:hypothetical protein